MELQPLGNTTLKGWQLDASQDLRRHIVGKIFKAVIMVPYEEALLDPRTRDYIDYVRKIENESFLASESKEEYYRLVAEKIYSIQNNHAEKTCRKRTDPASSTGSPHNPGPSTRHQDDEESGDADEDELFLRVLRSEYLEMDEATKERAKAKLMGTLDGMKQGQK